MTNFQSRYACMLLVVWLGCDAKETDTATMQTANTNSCELMINALENHNNLPVFQGNGSLRFPVFPNDYNWKEPKRIELLVETLATDSVSAWSQLVEHLEDERYCLTIRSDMSGYNSTVGHVCQQIIHETLTAGYIDDLPGDERLYPDLLWPNSISQNGLYKFCMERCPTGDVVYAIQAQNCDWAVERLVEIGTRDAEETAKSIRDIKQRSVQLRQTQTPIRLSSFFNEDRFVYPQSEAAERLRKSLQNK